MRGFFYRLIMRFAHRFNWHYAPPIYPEGDTQLWCKWCGFRQTIKRANDRTTASKKDMKKLIIILSFILILTCQNFRQVELKVCKSEYIRKLINHNCRIFNLNPRFVECLIKAESNFNISVISKAGAVGLGQLMPLTAEAEALKRNDKQLAEWIKKNPRKWLSMPDVNIYLTCSHIRTLLDNDKILDYVDLISSYNAGANNKAMADNKYITMIKKYYADNYGNVNFDKLIGGMK